MRERKVLDIGIAAGGEYIHNDENRRVMRIGLDKELQLLKKTKQTYDIDAVVANASFAEKRRLPFAENVFDEVDIFSPSDALLYSLIKESVSLWGDLRRVLRDQGTVHVYFDTRDVGRTLRVGSRKIKLHAFQNQLVSAAAHHGFTTYLDEISAEEVESLGTYFAEKNALEHGKDIRIYIT